MLEDADEQGNPRGIRGSNSNLVQQLFYLFELFVRQSSGVDSPDLSTKIDKLRRIRGGREGQRDGFDGHRGYLRSQKIRSVCSQAYLSPHSVGRLSQDPAHTMPVYRDPRATGVD